VLKNIPFILPKLSFSLSSPPSLDLGPCLVLVAPIQDMRMALAANSIIISQNRTFTSFDFPSSKLLSNRHSHNIYSHFQRIPPITITSTTPSSSIAKATLSDVQLQDNKKKNTINSTSTTSKFKFKQYYNCVQYLILFFYWRFPSC
jgi:hypothetical protein